MLRAAENGNVRKLRRLLENNANIEQRGKNGFSPLHYAARNGHEGAVRLLLENNADMTARENALHCSLAHSLPPPQRQAAAAASRPQQPPVDQAEARRDGPPAAPPAPHPPAPVLQPAEEEARRVGEELARERERRVARERGRRVAAEEELARERGRRVAAEEEAGRDGPPAAPPAPHPPAPALQAAEEEARRVGEELARERGRRAARERGRRVAAEEELARERGRRVAAEEEARRVGAELAREREVRVAAEEEEARARGRRVAAEEEARRVGVELAREREVRVAAAEEEARAQGRRVAAEEEARRVGVELARTREQLEAVLQAQQRSIAVIPIAELRGATDGFSNANKIGQGGFGSVFRTHQPLPSLPHSGPCAVKRLDASSMQGHAEVHSEIRVLSACWHEHLLPLVGFCLDEAAPCLVYPLMAGNLESRVVDVPQGQQRFSWRERVRAIRDATRALVYLHTPLAARSAVLHRDVKPSNILLDALGNAKLADVGLAREAPELQGGITHLTIQRLIGTPGFIDPLYTQSGRFSELTDGYAMGVSLLMCLGGRAAIPVVDRFGNALEGLAPAATFTDPTAEWPPDVAEQALEVVRGLIWGRLPFQRMELSQALSLLEAMADAQRLRPGIRDDAEDAERSCIVCMSAPRSVRFDCGHALCCTVNGCAAAILRRGVCPNCRVRISTMADHGDHIALQHTFVAVN